jgi:hypothetical protein
MDKSTAGIIDMAGNVEPPKMPSADLINFRFDQSDKQMSEVNRKLDQLTSNFATKAEVLTMKEEHVAKMLEMQHGNDLLARTVTDLKTRSDQQDGALISIKVAMGILTSVAALIGALWWLHP